MIFICSQSRAQINLVMNPSFEQYSTCPNYADEITYANHWNSLDSGWSAPDWADDKNGVPEYCNVCAGFYQTYCGVPANSIYYHYPRTGNGMAQVLTFYNEWGDTVSNTYKRDYLQGHLSSTLIAGQSYCVSFYVVLTNTPYANNKIGAYIDNGSIDTTSLPANIQSEYTPQILETTVITDTLNWTKIEGSFVANGSERFITIGNFTDTAHMIYLLIDGMTSFPGPGYGYYLVDDISVIKSDAVASAGLDRVIPTISIDSVKIGDTLDSYLPTYWYVNGTKIDSNTAWIKVRPDTTTKYVVELHLCGGDVSYDTVVVWVATMGSAPVNKYATVQIYPIPATDYFTVRNGQGSLLEIRDLVGRELYCKIVQSENESIPINYLNRGVYMINIIDPETGQKVSKKLVKE